MGGPSLSGACSTAMGSGGFTSSAAGALGGSCSLIRSNATALCSLKYRVSCSLEQNRSRLNSFVSDSGLSQYQHFRSKDDSLPAHISAGWRLWNRAKKGRPITDRPSYRSRFSLVRQIRDGDDRGRVSRLAAKSALASLVEETSCAPVFSRMVLAAFSRSALSQCTESSAPPLRMRPSKRLASYSGIPAPMRPPAIPPTAPPTPNPLKIGRDTS